MAGSHATKHICDAIAEWNQLTRKARTWTKFKNTFIKANKMGRKALKLLINSSRVHSTNKIHDQSNMNATDKARLNVMFVQSMEAFVEATHESINNTVEEKLKDRSSGSNSNSDSGGGKSNDELGKSPKREIIAFHRKLVSGATASEGGDGSTYKAVDEDNAKEKQQCCTHCGIIHKTPWGNACWRKKENWDGTPNWFKKRVHKPSE